MSEESNGFDPLGLHKLSIPASDPLNIWRDDDAADLVLDAASFAARIRERCPRAYDEWEDEALTRAVVDHYPDYSSMIEPELRPEQLDFSELSSQKQDTFEFMVPAFLPDSPELLTAKINSETVARVLREKLNLLPGSLPEGDERTAQWEKVRAAMVADGEFQAVESEALRLFTAHLRDVSQIAVEITLNYSLAWALLPVLERAGGNAFRADFVQSLLQCSFERMDALLRNLRVEVERILDERAGSSDNSL